MENLKMESIKEQEIFDDNTELAKKECKL